MGESKIDKNPEIGEVKRMGDKRKNRRHASIRKSATKRVDTPEQQTYGNQIPEKLIPELSRLLDEGKINHGSALLYAKVSTKNQKKIYDTLMDNFINGISLKKEQSIA